MQSFFCERAIENAVLYGNALLKFISPNDVGLTGGHQSGFYLPKSVYQMFTPQPPEKGVVTKHHIHIEWQDNYETESVITWYGAKTRSEYRLTKFGRGFPYLSHDMVGDLLVLIRKTSTEFVAYVLDLDEDIEEIQATLGVQVSESWGTFVPGVFTVETEDECIERYFRKFAETLTDFPDGSVFSAETRQTLKDCLQNFTELNSDDALMKCIHAEYQLFKLAERQICHQDVSGLFRDIDHFLSTASSIMNRRKSRAGRSLENHFEQVLIDTGIPHKMRPRNVDGKPDIVIPSEAAYHDSQYPLEKLFVVGVKTTCKDRWRQVLNEGKRQPAKHIVTIQQGISASQLNEMHKANVTLVVPKRLHKDYPRDRDITLLGVDDFVSQVQASLN